MMEEKDKRVELMSELIRGIRVIKLHVWEEYFVSKILGQLFHFLGQSIKKIYLRSFQRNFQHYPSQAFVLKK